MSLMATLVQTQDAPGISRLHVLQQVLAAPGRYVRPWYIAYLLLGVVTAGMGLFNAALALGTVIGTFSSGPLVKTFGFQVVPVMAIVGIALSMVLGLRLDTTPEPATAVDGV